MQTITTLANYVPFVNHQTEAAPSPRISARTLWLLENPEAEGYESGQHQDFAIIVGLVNSGNTDEQIEQILLDYPTRYRRKHAIYAGSVTAWLYRALKKARALDDSPATINRRRKIREAQTLVSQMEMPNARTSETDRAVLLSLLEVAHSVGSYRFRKDYRTLQTMSLVKRQTAANAVERLSRFVKTNGFNDFGTLFELDLDAILSFSQHSTSNHSVEDGYWVHNEKILEHEIFSPKRFGKGCRFAIGHGLGKTSGFLYYLLRVQMTIDELERTSKKSKATIYRCLKRMEEIIDSTGEIHSLVEEIDGKWTRTSASLDDVCAAMRVEGKRRRVRLIAELEREAYRMSKIPKQ